jgi:DNA adenine methylase
MIDAPARPVLRYHGGKWRLAPWIISNFPTHKTYVEPFGGGASVLMRKPRSYAEVYNDLDGDVVNLFRVLRDPALAHSLRQALELTPFARDEHKESYEQSGDPVEAARRTITRSFMGFGSSGTFKYTGFRTNTKRTGTIPAHDWRGYPDEIPAIVDRLRGVIIENRPAVDVIRQYDGPDTLHYVDPPYVHSTRGASNRYRFEMDEAEHRQLADALHGAFGSVIVSGYACELYDMDLFSTWKRVERNTHADDHTNRVEVLWVSPKAQQLDLFSAL